MSDERNSATSRRDLLRIVSWVTVGLFLVVAAAEVIFTPEGEGGLIRGGVAVGAAVGIAIGLQLLPRWPWPGALVTSLAAVAGAIFTIWLIIPLPLAIAIVNLSVSKARALDR